MKWIDPLMLRCLTVAIALTMLSSCARPPHQELDAAAYMVGRAYALQAMEFAPTEYQSAQTALTDARKAMDEASYADARDSLEFSLIHARRAVTLAQEGLAKRAREVAQRALDEERQRQEAEKKARAEKLAAKLAPPAPTPPPEPAPKPKPKPEIKPVTSYVVRDGENLWTISAQAQVYNDGLLWPLLYQANRDQIKDPRQIFPGQSLGIRRDMTEKDLEDARQKARESDIFPVPAQAP